MYYKKECTLTFKMLTTYLTNCFCYDVSFCHVYVIVISTENFKWSINILLTKNKGPRLIL